MKFLYEKLILAPLSLVLVFVGLGIIGVWVGSRMFWIFLRGLFKKRPS